MANLYDDNKYSSLCLGPIKVNGCQYVRFACMSAVKDKQLPNITQTQVRKPISKLNVKTETICSMFNLLIAMLLAIWV